MTCHSPLRAPGCVDPGGIPDGDSMPVCRVRTCSCWRVRRVWMPWVQHEPTLVGLLGTARYCAPAAPFSFVGRMLRDAARFRGLSRQAQRWSPVSGFRAIGVLLRHRRAHAPLTAKSPLPFPVGRRYHQQYPTSRRLPIALRDDAGKPYEVNVFDPPDAWLNAATSRRLWRASFSRTLCT